MTRQQEARLIRLEARPVSHAGPVFSFAAPPPWWDVLDVIASTPEAGMKALFAAMTDGDLLMLSRALECHVKHDGEAMGPNWEPDMDKVLERMMAADRRERLFGAKAR